MKDLANYLTENYKAGHALRVRFTKANGEERIMLVQKNDELLSQVKGVRHIDSPNALRVTETLADGTSQWRTVPLNRLISVDLLETV